MADFSKEHITFLILTIIFMVGSCYAVSKMSRKWQNVMFVFAAVMGAGGIFFAYAMGHRFIWEWNVEVLLVQTLQVCNFNFFLLPLMLIPRLEIARQYSIYFAMFAACTTLFSLPDSYAAMALTDRALITFLSNHVFAVALPLWMLSAGVLRPQRKYIGKVTIAVVSYFSLVFIISTLLEEFCPKYGPTEYSCKFSYVHEAHNMPILTQLYDLIGIPFVYLIPMIVMMVGFFYLVSLPFNRKVSFDGNGGNGKVASMYAVIDGEIQLPWGGFTREGYVLVGWRADPDGGEAHFDPGEKIKIGRVDFTLYAVWEKLRAVGYVSETAESVNSAPVYAYAADSGEAPQAQWVESAAVSEVAMLNNDSVEGQIYAESVSHCEEGAFVETVPEVAPADNAVCEVAPEDAISCAVTTEAEDASCDVVSEAEVASCDVAPEEVASCDQPTEANLEETTEIDNSNFIADSEHAENQISEPEMVDSDSTVQPDDAIVETISNENPDTNESAFAE